MVLNVLLLSSPSVVGELGVGVSLVFVCVPHPHLQVHQRMVGGVVTSEHRNFGHSVRSPVERKLFFHSNLVIRAPSKIYSKVGIVVVGLGLSHAALVIVNSIPSYIGALRVVHTRSPRTYIPH